jgi:uncharacterized Zn finger protein
MKCPTCTEELEELKKMLNDQALSYLHWCPECGTLVDDLTGTKRDVFVPKGVKR